MPHAHLLIKLHADCIDPHHIDAVVSAEMPDNAEDHELIKTFMIHHHVLDSNRFSKYCVHEDRVGRRWCHFNYPKPLQMNTTLDAEGQVQYRCRHKDN